MHFPTVFEWIDRLDFLRGLPAAYLALISALIVVVLWDWRLAVLALALQYLAVGLLYVDVLDPRLAIIKVLVGWFICLMLYFTARQIKWGRIPQDVGPEEAVHTRNERHIRLGPLSLPNNAPFHIFVGLMVALAALTMAGRPAFRLPAASEPMNVAVFGLSGLGLVGLSLTREPLKAGMGLLIFMSGFQLFYNTLEQSVAMLVFLAIGDLVLTLVIAYLTQARHTPLTAFRQEG